MLPNKFCCVELRKGAKFMGVVSFLVSLLCSMLLLFYLFYDYESIVTEIADNDPHIVENLNEHKTCNYFLSIFIDPKLIELFLYYSNSSNSCIFSRNSHTSWYRIDVARQLCKYLNKNKI